MARAASHDPPYSNSTLRIIRLVRSRPLAPFDSDFKSPSRTPPAERLLNPVLYWDSPVSSLGTILIEVASMSNPRILVADDEPELTDLYAEWLSDSYTVDTAYNGEQALDVLGASTDVVLLDRRMPDLSGGEVLAEIHTRGFDCMVVMVTSVTPDVDVLAMDFDTYLTKPATEDDLNEVVEQMLARAGYEDHFQDLFALVSKRATIQANAEVDAGGQYQDLEARIDELQQQVDDELAKFSGQDFKSVFSMLESDHDVFHE